jgi:hypothetical protein
MSNCMYSRHFDIGPAPSRAIPSRASASWSVIALKTSWPHKSPTIFFSMSGGKSAVSGQVHILVENSRDINTVSTVIINIILIVTINHYYQPLFTITTCLTTFVHNLSYSYNYIDIPYIYIIILCKIMIYIYDIYIYLYTPYIIYDHFTWLYPKKSDRALRAILLGTSDQVGCGRQGSAPPPVDPDGDGGRRSYPWTMGRFFMFFPPV